ncbi:PepSY domain-containing protein [Altererythrobacter sp. Root672]|uniref:PepSY domain-containing protein n=1 Tax=Altererythrobacter sp. Root672 TaxID=1736584 RepID=UPI0012E3C1C4|nr:PepSY domain-containing protein [Altererythrobacter sp. Root672]
MSSFTRLARWARRMMFLTHRWLGIVLALLMAIWAISGITMMYVAFPDTSAEEQAAGLQPLDLSGCCDHVVLPGGVAIEAATVEMVDGQPALRWRGPESAGLASLGENALPTIDAAAAGRIAAGHTSRAFVPSGPPTVEQIDRDQWTVYGRFRQHQPIYKASFADERGTVLYVSGLTGQIIQDTTSHERFWNWLGAVPHWLYFTALREIQPLWYNLVVYASALGVLLSISGIYVGLIMWRKGKRWSPFRGIALWHHWTGLIFGVVTLTWVASGLFSMNPWGWFESDGPGEVIPNLEGRPLQAADVETLYKALAANPQPGVVSAEISVQEGSPWAILVRPDGSRERYSLPGLTPAPLDNAKLATLARIAKPTTRIASAELITVPDSYHYAHKDEHVVLPAYRVIYANADATRLYFDPRTGELVNFLDGPSRSYRWLHYGLHRLDFPGLRARPVWDLVTVPLLIGVSLLCVLGVWMGIRRLRRPAAGVKRGASGSAP